MAVGFRQRLAALTGPKAGRKELLRSRSAGLPGRFHPVVAGLHDSVDALVAWIQAPAQAACTAWIGAGMDHLGNLLSALTGLLHHPEVQDPERRRCNKASSWTERLLRDLILLADAHGCFCEVLVSLKQLLAEAQAAARHRDAARLAVALRVRCRSDRALSHLASTLRTLTQSHLRSSSSTTVTSGSGEAALAEVVAAATCAVAAASAAIFAGLASASASSALRALTSPTAASPAKAMEGLRSLEECVVATEDGCEQVHRAVVNTRMSLLNVLTPC
ncbi:unnamed protein product [Alopecurus aequalis]